MNVHKTRASEGKRWEEIERIMEGTYDVFGGVVGCRALLIPAFFFFADSA